MNKTWMIYGATGYTGRLVAEQAKRESLTPVLAGRDRDSLDAVGREFGLSTRVFSLDDLDAVPRALQNVAVMAHCAGPFSATSAPMRAACLRAGCHYVDITGEVAVFEAAHAEDAAAREAGIVMCPGVGFDVIPTDCVAACLKSALPDATHLALGFDSGSGPSKGTATTAVEGLATGGIVRADGQLRRVPFGYGQREISFGGEVKHAMAIPWGDVATAWFSTGIPNIEVFVPVKRAYAVGAWLLNPLRPLLASRPAQKFLKEMVNRRVAGPDGEAREMQRTRIWGEVSNHAGERRTANLETSNIYDVTVHGVLLAVRRLLSYDETGGYFTPSQLMGDRCVELLPGAGRIAITAG